MVLWDITAVVEKGEVMKIGLRTKATVPVTAERKPRKAKGHWEVGTSIIGSV